MSGVADRKYLTLALHPNSKGVGWIAVSGPFSLFAWGTISTRRPDKNVAYLKRIERLLDRLDPDTLMLEAFGPIDSARRGRVASLCQSITEAAAARGIDLHIYTFAEVRRRMNQIGPPSRHAIAEEVCKTFPAIAHLLPRRRRVWDTERLRMTIFSSAAIVITHYAATANTLLQELR